MKIEIILLLLSPIFLTCIAIEYCTHRQNYSLKDSISSTVLALLHQGADLLALTVLMPVFLYLHQWRLFDVELSPLTVLIAFIFQDFLYYWFHRASHSIHWMWAAHVVHHSSPKMNLTTAFRQSFMYPIAGMWLFWTPMVLIGFPVELTFLVVALNLAFQFFVHTQAIKRLGWLEHIFNTPSHHRVHHSVVEQHIDKNFAGVLILWDKLFGTFEKESETIPCQYGAVDHPYLLNPVKATFWQWKFMLLQCTNKKGISAKLKVLFGDPNDK